MIPEQHNHELQCAVENKIFSVKSFLIRWNDQPACAHYITDSTQEKQYQEKIENLAYTDTLTTLYNRRFFEKSLWNILDQNIAFSFCLVDLDDLKYVNDNFGHPCGDDYIKTLASQMLATTRPTDIVARIGGDEFATLFLDCPTQAVASKMEQLNQKLHLLSKEYPMSVSCGIVGIDADTSLTPSEIMALADETMYEVKKEQKAGVRVKQ